MRTNSATSNKHSKRYICRLCRHAHALRKCNKFLAMNALQRQQVVLNYGYCKNCLAHKHSEGTCFTKTGCRYCHKTHHSLLHENPRLKKNNTSSSTVTKPVDSSCKPSSNLTSSTKATMNSDVASLTAVLKQNATTLLPTMLAKINTKEGKFTVRCLLDSGCRMSSISSRIVKRQELTTLTLDDETICPLVLYSIFDSEIQIETTLRVNNRISIHTPTKSVGTSIKNHFQNLVLADKEFFKSSSIDIILGVDIYSKLIREGVINKFGLPTAQNTIFGWVLYGTYST